MGGDQFSKVSRVKGICEAKEQTMPISAVTTESANPVANINTALWVKQHNFSTYRLHTAQYMIYTMQT